MLKPHILFDHTKTSKKIKNFLDHKIKNISLGKCNLIIVGFFSRNVILTIASGLTSYWFLIFVF